jgi:hypothetical protein
VTDLEALKQKVTMRQVVTPMLELKLDKEGRCGCPLCKSGGDRIFRVFDSTNSFYCYSCKKGGHIVTLVRAFYNCNAKEAGDKIGGRFGIDAPFKPNTNGGGEKTYNVAEWGKNLDPAHAALAPLNLSEETLKQFGAGYNASKPFLKGKLCLPVRQPDGTLFAYLGIDVESREVTLPKQIGPTWLYNNDRITAGTLHVVSHPLDVLYQLGSGVPDLENTIAVLCPITPELLDIIAAFARERDVGCLEFH